MTRLEQLVMDVGHALRMMWKSPGTTAAVVLSLAIGIGANTAMFAGTRSLLLDPLGGVEDSGSLVLVFAGVEGARSSYSYPDFEDLRAQDIFADVIVSRVVPVTVAVADTPERSWATLASRNYFDVLGAEMRLGRGFGPGEEDDSATVAVLSHGMWRRAFGSDPGVVDRSIDVNGRAVTVIGVASPGFTGTSPILGGDLWIPVRTRSLLTGFEALARLKPGMTLREARAGLDVWSGQMASEHPEAWAGRAGRSEPALAGSPR